MLDKNGNYQSRFVERVKVKGRQGVVKVYEIYDADLAELRAQKVATHNQLQLGIDHYSRADFSASQQIMTNILSSFPEDQVASLYLKQSQHYLRTGISDNWSGVFEMEHK